MRFFSFLSIALLLGTGCGGSSEPSLADGSIRNEYGNIETAGQVGVLRLVPGYCFQLGDDEIEFVDAVPCEDEHIAEVFAVFDLADSDWPGAAAVSQIAKSGCLDRFRTATGHNFDPVHMAITGYAPSERSWVDDKRVLCVVTAHDLSLVRGRVTR